VVNGHSFILIHLTASLERHALAEVCTVPVLLALPRNYSRLGNTGQLVRRSAILKVRLEVGLGLGLVALGLGLGFWLVGLWSVRLGLVALGIVDLWNSGPELVGHWVPQKENLWADANDRKSPMGPHQQLSPDGRVCHQTL